MPGTPHKAGNSIVNRSSSACYCAKRPGDSPSCSLAGLLPLHPQSTAPGPATQKHPKDSWPSGGYETQKISSPEPRSVPPCPMQESSNLASVGASVSSSAKWDSDSTNQSQGLITRIPRDKPPEVSANVSPARAGQTVPLLLLCCSQSSTHGPHFSQLLQAAVQSKGHIEAVHQPCTGPK